MKEDKKVSWEGIAWPNMYSIEALMNILEKKGVITKQEVIEELRKPMDEHQKDVNYPPQRVGGLFLYKTVTMGMKNE